MLYWMQQNKIGLVASLAVISQAAGAILFHLNRDMFHDFFKSSLSDYPWLVNFIGSPLYNVAEGAIVWSPTAITAAWILITCTHWSRFERGPSDE